MASDIIAAVFTLIILGQDGSVEAVPAGNTATECVVKMANHEWASLEPYAFLGCIKTHLSDEVIAAFKTSDYGSIRDPHNYNHAVLYDDSGKGGGWIDGMHEPKDSFLEGFNCLKDLIYEALDQRNSNGSSPIGFWCRADGYTLDVGGIYRQVQNGE